MNASINTVVAAINTIFPTVGEDNGGRIAPITDDQRKAIYAVADRMGVELHLYENTSNNSYPRVPGTSGYVHATPDATVCRVAVERLEDMGKHAVHQYTGYKFEVWLPGSYASQVSKIDAATYAAADRLYLGMAK